MALAKVNKCNKCDKNVAHCYCYDCGRFLCDTCKHYHEFFLGTHTVTGSEKVDKTLTSLKKTCDTHGQNFLHYCETCEQLICVTCATTNHKSHSFSSISETVAKERIKVKETYDEWKKRSDQFSNLINTIENSMKTKVDKTRESYLREVKAISNELLTIIQTVTKMFTTRADDYLNSEQQHLDSVLKSLKDSRKECICTCQEFDSILNVEHDMTFLVRRASILKAYPDIPDLTEPHDLESFEHESFIQQIFEKIQDAFVFRLNSMAGNQLTKGIPNITDLSDPNRPMKIGDQFMELYDYEWTDAIECTRSVKSLFPDLNLSQIEEIVIRHLFQIITVCYKECLAISQKQVENIVEAVNDMIPRVDDEYGSKTVGNLPGLKELMELRRQNAEKFADHLFENKVMIKNINLKDWLNDQKNEELVNLLTETPFFEKCVHLCWYMVIQDPVMHLDEELIPDTTYDKNLYREFTCCGKKVRFVIWPALSLYKEGPVLCKGVVQAYS